MDDGTALDIGCGSGSLAVLLAGHAESVVGIDISPALIFMARERRRRNTLGNLAFLVADAEKLPFRVPSFDLVVSYGVLHHMDADCVLPKIDRLLKPGGTAVIFDYVASNPRLNASVAWQIARALRSVPKHLESYGIRAAWRILLFRLSPGWLRHVCSDCFPTLEAFEGTFQSHFSSCRFRRYGGLIAAAWQSA